MPILEVNSDPKLVQLGARDVSGKTVCGISAGKSTGFESQVKQFQMSSGFYLDPGASSELLESGQGPIRRDLANGPRAIAFQA